MNLLNFLVLPETIECLTE